MPAIKFFSLFRKTKVVPFCVVRSQVLCRSAAARRRTWASTSASRRTMWAPSTLNPPCSTSKVSHSSRPHQQRAAHSKRGQAKLITNELGREVNNMALRERTRKQKQHIESIISVRSLQAATCSENIINFFCVFFNSDWWFLVKCEVFVGWESFFAGRNNLHVFSYKI